VEGEIFCEGETLGGEFSLLFFVIFLLVNMGTDPIGWIARGEKF